MNEASKLSYRQLKRGERIHPFDEVLVDSSRGWQPPSSATIGTPAPDPGFTSHRIYRRQVLDDGSDAYSWGSGIKRGATEPAFATTRHVAGETDGLVQRCSRCGGALVDHSQTMAPDGYKPRWFDVGTPVLRCGGATAAETQPDREAIDCAQEPS